MNSRRHSLIFLMTTLIVVLVPKSAKAFSLRGSTSGSSENFLWYDGTSTVQTFQVSLLPIPQQNDPFMVALRRVFSDGWQFDTTSSNLLGKFNVDKNLPDGGLRGFTPHVGSQFNLSYIPEETEPSIEFIQPPDPSKLHWIQQVTNFRLQNRKGELKDFIDVPNTWNNPFYDTVPSQGSESIYTFKDYPSNLYSGDWLFNAELYLVGETTSAESTIRTVTIYNGVSWGWSSKFTPLESIKKFSDSLSSGTEVDNFSVSELTPGANFYAWINNDLPSNRCNPNTLLSTDNKSDDNSSPLGDSYASAMTGIVPSNGLLNLSVRAANGGRRGEDKGNYELYVKQLDPGENPPSPVERNAFSPPVSVGSSGGGGVGNEGPGRTQQNPLLPDATEQEWQVFHNVPGCRWYDPPTTQAFEFQALENTLFSEILDFPVGADNLFTVSVGDTRLGEFSPGQSVDFVSLLGSGVANFKISGIDSLVGTTATTAFPIQLAFNDGIGSFKMRPISESQSVPEPNFLVSLVALGFSLFGKRK